MQRLFPLLKSRSKYELETFRGLRISVIMLRWYCVHLPELKKLQEYHNPRLLIPLMQIPWDTIKVYAKLSFYLFQSIMRSTHTCTYPCAHLYTNHPDMFFSPSFWITLLVLFSFWLFESRIGASCQRMLVARASADKCGESLFWNRSFFDWWDVKRQIRVIISWYFWLFLELSIGLQT